MKRNGKMLNKHCSTILNDVLCVDDVLKSVFKLVRDFPG